MSEEIEIVYPIPLSDGRVITIRNLPDKLKKEDAEKISRVVMALVVE